MTHKYRKGSRRGEPGDSDEAHLFIHLYEQDTTDNNTLKNRWNALSNDEQEYVLFQFGESRQDFEETFNQSSHEGSRKGSRRGSITEQQAEELFGGYEDYQDFLDDIPEARSWNYQQLKYFVEHEGDTGFYIDQVERMGSGRKGGPTIDQVYDLMEFISDAREVTDKYFDGYDKEFEELTPMELTSLFNDLKQRYPSEYKDYVDSIDGAYLGRKGSRKGAEPFATSGFNKAVNGITGTLKSKPVMNTLKRTTGTEDQKNQVALEDKANSDAKKARSEQVRRNSLTEEQRQAEDNQKAAEKAFNDHQNREDVEKRTQEVFKQNGVEYPKKKGRRGTGPLCDLGNISGKGSRPENLGQISSGIVAGRKRSIRLEGEYAEDSRQGSRKGSRNGSSIWTLKGSERQELYNLIDAKLKSEGHPWDYVYTVTGKDYEDSAYSEFAEMPENKDWINGLILEITRDRQGSAPKSRK